MYCHVAGDHPSKQIPSHVPTVGTSTRPTTNLPIRSSLVRVVVERRYWDYMSVMNATSWEVKSRCMSLDDFSYSKCSQFTSSYGGPFECFGLDRVSQVLGELWLNIGDIWEKYSAADTTVCLLKAIGKVRRYSYALRGDDGKIEEIFAIFCPSCLLRGSSSIGIVVVGLYNHSRCPVTTTTSGQRFLLVVVVVDSWVQLSCS